MPNEQLAERLKAIYWSSSRADTVISIIMFGIANAEQIKLSGLAPRELIRMAELPDSYAAELRKGIRLARYVELREEKLKSP